MFNSSISHYQRVCMSWDVIIQWSKWSFHIVSWSVGNQVTYRLCWIRLKFCWIDQIEQASKFSGKIVKYYGSTRIHRRQTRDVQKTVGWQWFTSPRAELAGYNRLWSIRNTDWSIVVSSNLVRWSLIIWWGRHGETRNRCDCMSRCIAFRTCTIKLYVIIYLCVTTPEAN